MIILTPVMIILILTSKTQHYLSLWSHYKQKTNRNYENVLVNCFEDQYIATNIKQKVKAKIYMQKYRYFLIKLCKC